MRTMDDVKKFREETKYITDVLVGAVDIYGASIFHQTIVFLEIFINLDRWGYEYGKRFEYPSCDFDKETRTFFLRWARSEHSLVFSSSPSVNSFLYKNSVTKDATAWVQDESSSVTREVFHVLCEHFSVRD